MELGYRYSDYDPSGTDDTWKAGLNWRPVDSLLFRVMRQRAARAPNVGELSDPQVTGLANANLDPCSTIRRRRGLTPQVELSASDRHVGRAGRHGRRHHRRPDQHVRGHAIDDLPQLEQADTTTVGFVWTPDLDTLQNASSPSTITTSTSTNYIDTFSAQEVLDGCYVLGLASECGRSSVSAAT